jgi:hypothetical protein
MGWRFPTGRDKQALETWLRTHGAPEAPTEEESCERAYARLRELGLELAADKALQRMVRAALHGFFTAKADGLPLFVEELTKMESGVDTEGMEMLATPGQHDL